MAESRKGFVRGRLCLRLAGGHPEQLLQAAAQAGIALWDIRPQQQGCTVCMFARDLRLFRTFRRSCGCSVRVAGRYGLPFLASRLGISRALVFGVLLALLQLYLLGGCVFLQQYSGSADATPYELSQYLSQFGLVPFARRSGLDAARLGEQLVASPYGISWAAVNFHYGRAEIELRAAVRAPSPHSEASALTALYDCQLTRLQVTSGAAQKEVGDVVRAGEVLVAQAESLHSGAWAGCVEARAWGYVQHTETLRIPKYHLQRIPTGESAVRRSLVPVCGAKRQSRSEAPFRYSSCQTQYHAVRIFSVPLPLLIRTERFSEVRQCAQYLNEAQAAVLCEQQLQLFEQEQLADARVVSRRVQCADAGDSFVFTARYLLEREVGCYAP